MGDILVIPVDANNASFKERVELEQKEFVFKFDWNDRLDRWHVSLMDGSENPLVMGITLVANWNLFGRFKGYQYPAGSVILYDASGRYGECGRDALGKTHFLLYKESV